MPDLTKISPDSNTSDFVVSSFAFRQNGLEPLGTPTFEQWLDCGKFIKKSMRSVHLWIGDWVNYGEQKYGEMYRDAMDTTGFEYQTLRNDKWVSSRIELSRRRDNLSFDHYSSVADLPEDEQDELLFYAEKNKVSTKDFRKYVSEKTFQNVPNKSITPSSDHQENTPTEKLPDADQKQIDTTPFTGNDSDEIIGKITDLTYSLADIPWSELAQESMQLIIKSLEKLDERVQNILSAYEQSQ